MATYTSNYAWTKPAGSDPVDIGVLNNNLDSQDGIMHDAFLNMADPFSESSTYAVGDIVVYGTKTYKCHTAVTTAGSWTGSTNWTAYKLSEGGSALVAGDYVNIENGVINVQTEIGTYDNIRYNFTPTNGGYYVTVTVYVNDVQRFQQSYHNDDLNGHPVVIEDLIEFWYGGDGYYWHYMPLIDSNEHVKDTDIRWYYNEMTEHEETFAVPQDDSTTLVTKGDLDDALDDKVDKVTGKGLSTNDYDNTAKGIVDGVTANLALKADKTATASGESLTLSPTSEGRALLHTAYGMSVQDGTPTPSSPVDIVSAKADLRSVGKNLIPLPYYYQKENGNPWTSVWGVTYTVDNEGAVTLNGTSSNTGLGYRLIGGSDLASKDLLLPIKPNTKYIITGAPSEAGSGADYIARLYYTVYSADTVTSIQQGVVALEGTQIITPNTAGYIRIVIDVKKNATYNNLTFKPMLRLADVEDSAYEPYTKHDTTTDLTLRAIEVTSSDAYNLVRDGKYYIADTLDYDEDNGWSVTRRVGVSKASDVTWQGINVNGYNINTTQLNNLIATTSQNPILTKYFQPTHALSAVPENSIAKFTNVNISTTVVSGATTDAERKTMWDTWLSTHDFDIVYILATPTTETITTAQALALLGLKTYDESTTISSQAEPSCTIAVEYAKERLGALALTAYNTAKGNDLRITALEG